MEILRQIMIWLFGILAIGFLIMTFVSLFLHGSTLYWVSEKANTRSHIFLFLASLSGVLWGITKSPENISIFLFCMLPMAILFPAFSYVISRVQRKFAERIVSKMNINPKNPFKNPFKKN